MTQVKNYDLPADKEAIIGAYLAFEETSSVRTAGVEVEQFVLTKDGALPDAARHERFFLDARHALRDAVSVEPGSHQIEIKTGVHTDADGIKSELAGFFTRLSAIAERHGLNICRTSDLSQFTSTELIANLTNQRDPETGKVRRAHEQVLAYRKHGFPENAEYAASTVSIQFTHNVRNAERLLRWGRVQAALSPLNVAVFENRERLGGTSHEGLRKRRALGEKGLIDPNLFRAESDEDFVRLHVDGIYNTRLFTLLDARGQDEIVPFAARFKDLAPELQTLGNFLQAGSSTWNNTKIRTLLDEAALAKGNIRIRHMLLEARDIDTSERGAQAVAEWQCDLTRSDAALQLTEAGLEDCGVPVVTDPTLAEKKIMQTLLELESNPAYLETAFGSGTLRDVITRVCLPIASVSAEFWMQARDSHGPMLKAQPLFAPAARKPGVLPFNFGS